VQNIEGTGKVYAITDFTNEMNDLPHAQISETMKETISNVNNIITIRVYFIHRVFG